MSTFIDMVCPECANILNEKNVHIRRLCPNCFARIEEKSTEEKPSYEPTSEVIKASREKQKDTYKDRLKNLRDQQVAGAVTEIRRQDSLKFFRHELLEERTLPTTATIGSHSVSISLPADQLDVKDVDAIRQMVSRRQEIESRKIELEREIAQTGKVPQAARSKLPSEASLTPLLEIRSRKEPEKNKNALVSDSINMSDSEPYLVPTSRCAWDCVWCEESNSEAARVTCSGCGADTGPEAIWRSYKFCPRDCASEDSGSSVPSNLQELSYRLKRIETKSREEVVAAAYWLLLFRKKFLLEASEKQLHGLNNAVLALCSNTERVMAAYIFFRIIPSAVRSRDCLKPLMTLFGTNISAPLLEQEEPGSIAPTLIIGPGTCLTCFDLQHTWKQCPIITRRISNSSVSKERKTVRGIFSDSPQKLAEQNEPLKVSKPTLSSGEEIQRGIDRLLLAISRTTESTARRTFSIFLDSPGRNIFCETHPIEANVFVRHLAGRGHFKQAAYVLNHIPRHLRENESYQEVAKRYSILPDEIDPMLRYRRLGDQDANHPFFSQVFQVCCICLTEKHVSFSCPMLESWFKAEISPQTSNQTLKKFKGLTVGQNQALAFASSGPERLAAFVRFLKRKLFSLKDMSELRAVGDGINAAIQELVRVDRANEAVSILLRVPRTCITRETLERVMGYYGTAKEDIMYCWKSSNRFPLELLLPSTVCWSCFRPGHPLLRCLEYESKTPDVRIRRILEGLLEINQPTATAGAVDYLSGLYIRCRYISVIQSRSMSELLERLLLQCLQQGDAVRGFKVFRLMAHCSPSTTGHFWRPFQISASVMHHLTPDKTLQELSTILKRNGVCPICMIRADHNVACPTLQAEQDLGRNMLAIFRMEMLLGDEVDARHIVPGELPRHTIVDRLANIVIRYQNHLPYHIPHVRVAINAIGCHYFVDNYDVARGMTILQAIPMQYRKPLLYHRCLQAFGLSDAKMIHNVRTRLAPHVDLDEIVFLDPVPEDLFALRETPNLCHNCWRFGHDSKSCPNADDPLLCALQTVTPVQIFNFQRLIAEVDAVQCDFETTHGMLVGTRCPLMPDIESCVPSR